MSDFHAEQSSDSTTDHLIFSGNIDENSHFPDVKNLTSQALEIDLDKIQMINSLGIRSWTRWMKELDAKVITLKNCPPSIVQQMNIVSGFLPSKAVVQSFYIPFYCDHCDSESVVLLTRNKEFTPKTLEMEAQINFDKRLPCEDCGEEREVDVLEEKYFAFLKRG